MEEKKAARIKDKKLLLFGAVALAGVLVLTLGKFVSDKNEAATQTVTSTMDPNVYARSVESEVIKLCQSVIGDREVNVVVSLDGGYRSVYASDHQSSSSGYKSNTVLVGSGNDEGAVLVCYENPKISGIGIVLSCNESEKVKNSIISLVSSAFNVGTNKIHVAFGRK